MAELDVEEIRRKLQSKFGFIFKARKKKHDRYVLYLEGRQHAFVDVPRHKDPARDALIALMARQARVTGPQFREMIDCTRSREIYLAGLVANSAS